MNLLTFLTTPLHPAVSVTLIAPMVFAALVVVDRTLRDAK